MTEQEIINEGINRYEEMKAVANGATLNDGNDYKELLKTLCNKFEMEINLLGGTVNFVEVDIGVDAKHRAYSTIMLRDDFPRYQLELFLIDLAWNYYLSLGGKQIPDIQAFTSIVKRG